MIIPATYFIGAYAALSVYKASSFFWMKMYDEAFKEFANSPLFHEWEEDGD